MHGKANNKYMKEYDEKAPSKYIMYLDANNLYGYLNIYLPVVLDDLQKKKSTI